MSDAALLAAFVAGVALVAYGAWAVFDPAGFIVAGAALILVPLLYVRGRRAG